MRRFILIKTFYVDSRKLSIYQSVFILKKTDAFFGLFSPRICLLMTSRTNKPTTVIAGMATSCLLSASLPITLPWCSTRFC